LILCLKYVNGKNVTLSTIHKKGHHILPAASNTTVIKCRRYPTKEQEARLQSTLDICRDLYNYFVFESRIAYKEGDDKLRHFEMSMIVPGLTKGKEIYSKVAQPVADRDSLGICL
jgi:hypothetical protein